MGRKGVGWEQVEVKSCINLATSSMMHIGVWGQLAELGLQALVEDQKGEYGSHLEEQDVPTGRCHSRKDSSPGTHQLKFLNRQGPQYAPSAGIDEIVPQIARTHAMAFKCDNQDLELHLEANLQPLKLMEHRVKFNIYEIKYHQIK